MLAFDQNHPLVTVLDQARYPTVFIAYFPIKTDPFVDIEHLLMVTENYISEYPYSLMCVNV